MGRYAITLGLPCHPADGARRPFWGRGRGRTAEKKEAWESEGSLWPQSKRAE